MSPQKRNLFEKLCHNAPKHLRKFLYWWNFDGPIANNQLTNDILCTLNDEPFYKEYKYSKRQIESHRNCTKWRIIEAIQSYIQNIIKENRDIWISEIIEKIRPDLVTLSRKEKDETMRLIYKIAEKFNTVRKYLDFKNWPYKSPKELLCAIRWITDLKIIEKITDDITVRPYWIWFMFFVWNKCSYQILFDKSLNDSWIESWWFNNSSDISNLTLNFSVIKWKDPGINRDAFEYCAILHEWQHSRDRYFMPDYTWTPSENAKTEITAYLRIWMWIFEKMYLV